jgi:hypothetical protein
LITEVNDQAIASSFFKTGRYLTSYITPDNLDVKALFKRITNDEMTDGEKLLTCWRWVAQQVRYRKFIRGRLEIEGRVSFQHDLWQDPNLVIHTRVGNCANKAFLLASLARNVLSAGDVRCVLGNIYQGNRPPGGHAWVEVDMPSNTYIMESTSEVMQPMVVAKAAEIYEPVVYFNDETVSVVEERTLLQPFAQVYISWLKDYLDMAYIRGEK